MVGEAVAGQLTFAEAGSADEADLRRLLRENAMPGAVSLTFEREPEYFRGAHLAGGQDRTILAKANGRLVCLGRCSRRQAWVNGRATPAGYLAELRLDRSARGRFTLLREGYRFFHERELEDPAELYFTSIAADNGRARGLLERGVRGLPTYSFLAELETILVTVRRPRASALRLELATPAQLPAVLALLEEHDRRHQLATVWSAETLPPMYVSLQDGRVVACGALWDQRAFRQTVIRGYHGLLAALRPLASLAGGFAVVPRLPAPGSVLAQAFVSPLALAAGCETLLPDFLEGLLPHARSGGLEYLTLALPPGDSRLPALRRRFATRSWRSRLYSVHWPEQAPPTFDATPFLPEVALL